MNNGDNQPAEGNFLSRSSLITVPLCAAVAGLILSTVIMAILTARNDEQTFVDGFKDAWDGGSIVISAFTSFLFCALAFFYEFNKRSIKLHKDIVDAIAEKPIVLHPPIQPFDPETLKEFEDLLHARSGPQHNLIALDATDPLEWWSNDMLGYLALQAKWVMEKDGRTIQRVFVWDTPAIRSPAGSKLLWLHAMFGFKTIICHKAAYYSKKVISGPHGRKQLQREFLIWDNENNASAATLKSGAVFGFESVWTTDTTELQRKDCRKKGKSVFRHIKDKPDATYRVQFRNIEAEASAGNSKILVLSNLTSEEIQSKLETFGKTLT